MHRSGELVCATPLTCTWKEIREEGDARSWGSQIDLLRVRQRGAQRRAKLLVFHHAQALQEIAHGPEATLPFQIAERGRTEPVVLLVENVRSLQRFLPEAPVPDSPGRCPTSF